MNLVRCNGCGERPEAKLTQTTFAWRRADNVRVAHRARLCLTCFATQVAPLSIQYAPDARLTCPKCGIDTEDDMDAIYTTSYLPNYGEFKTESPFCGACAAIARVWIVDHSWPLEDQLGATGSPQLNVTGADVLRALGIEPRGTAA